MNGLHVSINLLLLEIIFLMISNLTVCLTQNQQQGGRYGNEKSFFD